MGEANRFAVFSSKRIKRMRTIQGFSEHRDDGASTIMNTLKLPRRKRLSRCIETFDADCDVEPPKAVKLVCRSGWRVLLCREKSMLYEGQKRRRRTGERGGGYCRGKRKGGRDQ